MRKLLWTLYHTAVRFLHKFIQTTTPAEQQRRARSLRTAAQVREPAIPIPKLCLRCANCGHVCHPFDTLVPCRTCDSRLKLLTTCTCVYLQLDSIGAKFHRIARADCQAHATTVTTRPAMK